MGEIEVSIGRVKRDISELVNRVAYGGERVILTSRGKPKAVLVSMEDYERLRQGRAGEASSRFQAWLAANEAISREILERRGGKPIDVEELLRASRAELEARSEWVLGRGCQSADDVADPGSAADPSA